MYSSPGGLSQKNCERALSLNSFHWRNRHFSKKVVSCNFLIPESWVTVSVSRIFSVTPWIVKVKTWFFRLRYLKYATFSKNLTLNCCLHFDDLVEIISFSTPLYKQCQKCKNWISFAKRTGKTNHFCNEIRTFTTPKSTPPLSTKGFSFFVFWDKLDKTSRYIDKICTSLKALDERVCIAVSKYILHEILDWRA